VSECHLDVQVAVLDRASDKATGLADDVPGQGAAEAGRSDPAVRVGRDGLAVAAGGLAIGADPSDEGSNVIRDGAGRAARAS
jgi:hypothetical protein